MSGAAPSSSSSAMSPAAKRLDEVLAEIRAAGRVGLMTHIVYGYPDVATSRAIIDRMVSAGVDLIEVQIPFSDPTADGPVITQACQTALDGGARVEGAMELLRDVREAYPRVPFLFMSYANIAFGYRRGAAEGGGLARFVEDAARAGAAGLIVPDMPPDATDEGYVEACAASGLHPIWVVSPNTTEARLGTIGAVASGILYCTSRTGTTGREMDVATDDLGRFLRTAREVTGCPLAVGFSISKREHVDALRGVADVAVIGSHFIRVFERGGLDGLAEELGRFAG